jgi:hypothetical protein
MLQCRQCYRASDNICTSYTVGARVRQHRGLHTVLHLIVGTCTWDVQCCVLLIVLSAALLHACELMTTYIVSSEDIKGTVFGGGRRSQGGGRSQRLLYLSC